MATPRINDDIRRRVKTDLDRLTHRQIAKKYGIGVGTVSYIRNAACGTLPKDIVESGPTIDIVPEGSSLTSVGVIANDAQIPFQDDAAVALFMDFCRREQPDWIDLNGDWIDFYQISRFEKDPMRKQQLQQDIFALVALLERLRNENPNAQIYYEIGNHEKRLRKFLWTKGEEIASLECLRLESLLHFNDLGIVMVEKWRQQGDLYITHGTLVRKNAGYTAKAMYEKYGVSMIHGHTHRDGKFTRRTIPGHKCVWENYCLCDLSPEYDDFPDWTQGFSKVTMVGNRPYVEQIPIIQKQYIYGGKRYGVRKNISQKPKNKA